MAASSCSSRSWLRAFSKTSTGAFAVSLIAPECRLRPPWQACRSGRCERGASASASSRSRSASTATTRSGWRRWSSSGWSSSTRKKNPYFEHAEVELFVAERDGEPVGRISAQVDHRWDEYQGGSDAMFGFFETIEDPEVAQGSARRRQPSGRRAKGRNRMLGPMDFTTNDEIGILIEGFERRPMILEPWHPPFYKRADRGRGLREDDGRADVGAAVRQPQGGRELRSLDPRRRQEGAGGGRDRRSATSARAKWRTRCGASPTSTTRPGETTGASSRSPTPRSSSRPRT